MTFIIKSSLLARCQHLTLRASYFNKEFISLHLKHTRQISEPLTGQMRLCSSKVENLTSTNTERLYEGILNKKIRLVKSFSLLTSVGTLAGQPYLLSKVIETGNKVSAGGIFLVFGFFAFVTPLLLHILTKRYVLYLDYDPAKDTYIASTYSIFVQKKETEFKPEDVHLPDMSDMMTTCIVKGVPMFFDVKLFTDINHYKRIMGFDKPMDFSLDPEDTGTKKNE